MAALATALLCCLICSWEGVGSMVNWGTAHSTALLGSDFNEAELDR